MAALVIQKSSPKAARGGRSDLLPQVEQREGQNGEPCLAGAVVVHEVELLVARPDAAERDPCPVGRPARVVPVPRQREGAARGRGGLRSRPLALRCLKLTYLYALVDYREVERPPALAQLFG